jgi:hypothetical protein
VNLPAFPDDLFWKHLPVEITDHSMAVAKSAIHPAYAATEAAQSAA